MDRYIDVRSYVSGQPSLHPTIVDSGITFVYASTSVHKVYIYIYVYIYVCVYVYTYMYIHICIYVYIYVSG